MGGLWVLFAFVLLLYFLFSFGCFAVLIVVLVVCCCEYTFGLVIC